MAYKIGKFLGYLIISLILIIGVAGALLVCNTVGYTKITGIALIIALLLMALGESNGDRT